MDNPEKLATQVKQDEEKTKQEKNPEKNPTTTQYVLDTTIPKQIQIT